MSGGQAIGLQVGNDSTMVTASVTPVAGSWTKVDVPLSDLGSPRRVTWVFWFNDTAGAQATFHVDDVALVASGLPTPTPVPTGSGPAVSIDVSRDRRPIDPAIYGMNFADESLAAELHLPVRRWGGNATTRYDWRTDTSNRAADWFYENVPLDNDHPELLPDGSTTDRFVEQDRGTGTRTILTVPLIGWTPKDRAYACGFSVAKYGAQSGSDPWRPDCGSGLHVGGADVTGNDPLDTSVAIGPSFATDWIAHLRGRFGTAAAGGVAFYELDNEPMLWSSTHRDVHPSPTSYDEVRDRTIAWASAVKAADPGALTLGPAVWGWTAYFWSALDWAAGGSWWSSPPDRLAHGDVPFLRWYLRQMRAHEQSTGTRILDYLDVHYYPQAANVSLSPAGSATTRALRLRSTRSLWDPTYVDESWIGQPVRLVPMMREWIDAEYPGTKLAITEYNWGALDHPNGALAQAEVLGIFGREGVDLATLWDPPASGEPGAFAFRMYLDYDGAGSRFGDVSVHAASADPSRLSVFAAERSSDGALTILAVNKGDAPLSTTIALSGTAAPGSASRWTWSATSASAIEHPADLPVSGSSIPVVFAPSSITLLVVGDTTRTASCPAVPRTGCAAAAPGKSSLGIHGGGLATRRSLDWKWTGADEVARADFGNPTTTDPLDLCVYAGGSLALSTRAPAGGTCGRKPCWTAKSTGFAYASADRSPLGIGKVVLKAGAAGRSRITVSAKSALLPDPGLPLSTPVVVQATRGEGAACWQATYSSARR
ncbi:MAG: glycoside hydrolase family 44 protein, partial [Alphaproteobacteria bacterium]